MRARILLLSVSVLAAAGLVAGCTTDDESTNDTADDGVNLSNDSSATCLEGAEDCDDMSTMETIEDPYRVGT